jgi:hypothetical protein
MCIVTIISYNDNVRVGVATGSAKRDHVTCTTSIQNHVPTSTKTDN